MAILDNENKPEGEPGRLGFTHTREVGGVLGTYDSLGRFVGGEGIGTPEPAPKVFNSIDDVNAAIASVRADKTLEDRTGEKLLPLYAEKKRLMDVEKNRQGETSSNQQPGSPEERRAADLQSRIRATDRYGKDRVEAMADDVGDLFNRDEAAFGSYLEGVTPEAREVLTHDVMGLTEKTGANLPVDQTIRQTESSLRAIWKDQYEANFKAAKLEASRIPGGGIERLEQWATAHGITGDPIRQTRMMVALLKLSRARSKR